MTEDRRSPAIGRHRRWRGNRDRRVRPARHSLLHAAVRHPGAGAGLSAQRQPGERHGQRGRARSGSAAWKRPVGTTTSSGNQLDVSAFKTAVCNQIAVVPAAAAIAQLQVDVRTLSSFGQAEPVSPIIGTTASTPPISAFIRVRRGIDRRGADLLPLVVDGPHAARAASQYRARITGPSRSNSGSWLLASLHRGDEDRSGAGVNPIRAQPADAPAAIRPWRGGRAAGSPPWPPTAGVCVPVRHRRAGSVAAFPGHDRSCAEVMAQSQVDHANESTGDMAGEYNLMQDSDMVNVLAVARCDRADDLGQSLCADHQRLYRRRRACGGLLELRPGPADALHRQYAGHHHPDQ